MHVNSADAPVGLHVEGVPALRPAVRGEVEGAIVLPGKARVFALLCPRIRRFAASPVTGLRSSISPSIPASSWRSCQANPHLVDELVDQGDAAIADVGAGVDLLHGCSGSARAPAGRSTQTLRAAVWLPSLTSSCISTPSSATSPPYARGMTKMAGRLAPAFRPATDCLVHQAARRRESCNENRRRTSDPVLITRQPAASSCTVYLPRWPTSSGRCTDERRNVTSLAWVTTR
jgi:hypothetical protein